MAQKNFFIDGALSGVNGYVHIEQDLHLDGKLVLNGMDLSVSDGDHTPSGAGGASLSYDFPTADGTSGQYLTTDGSGNLSWTTLSGGGSGGLADVVDDTTPQLGGDLDVNGKWITSTSGNVALSSAGYLHLIGSGNHSVGMYDTYFFPSDSPTAGQVLAASSTPTQLEWTTLSSSGGSYGDSDVATYLGGNLDTHIIPNGNEVYDLGEPENKFRDLYLSNATIHTDGGNISTEGGVMTFGGEPVILLSTLQDMLANSESFEDFKNNISNM